MMSSKKERDAVMMSRPVMHTATAGSFADDDAALHQALRLAAKRPTREQKRRTNNKQKRGNGALWRNAPLLLVSTASASGIG